MVEDIGGILVDVGGPLGGLIDGPGQLQYGDMLTGAGTSAGWRELIGWRDTPEAQVADTLRPQATGAYPGSVYGGSLAVTYDYLLRGTPAAKLAAKDAIERYAPMDGVDRPLVVDDGSGPTWRMARVIGRQVPMDRFYRVAAVQCSLQFLCADPRRYSLAEHAGQVLLPESSGGLQYALLYPLTYGESSSGATVVTNAGSVATPLVATFNGPLTNPTLQSPDWSMGFDTNLVAGEQLVVDTAEGTALLNGTADRLGKIRPSSDPLELCQLQPGPTQLSLVAPSGTGFVSVRFRDARM